MVDNYRVDDVSRSLAVNIHGWDGSIRGLMTLEELMGEWSAEEDGPLSPHVISFCQVELL